MTDPPTSTFRQGETAKRGGSAGDTNQARASGMRVQPIAGQGRGQKARGAGRQWDGREGAVDSESAGDDKQGDETSRGLTDSTGVGQAEFRHAEEGAREDMRAMQRPGTGQRAGANEGGWTIVPVDHLHGFAAGAGAGLPPVVQPAPVVKPICRVGALLNFEEEAAFSDSVDAAARNEHGVTG